MIGEPEQEQIYTLTSADRPYRVIVESMGEGAATVSERGVILFANPQLARFLGVERDSMIGRDLTDYVGEDQRPALASPARRPSADDPASRAHDCAARRHQRPVPGRRDRPRHRGVLVRCLVLPT